ncbi:putative cytosolic iron-sulfur protein assembly protein 1 [Aulographum hederae CBS 113979]|uniref:Probable cytosolic iron-sulfur protein assembly protein 1 n=1 Tax=Aulographum hederae CBS 113979 TaxID=1176131 RepID=A0A6G1H4Z2_9PEZI|nr:putative cytosolic iron-sulfur protein assembly protein 1 [Aulographum hederae CBS 113979]
MPSPEGAPLPFTLQPLAQFSPASNSRTWLTAPHPRLPIVATASSDKTVRIYSLTSFKLLNTVSGGHKRSIRTCAWKPGLKGESVLATGSFDASAGIWRRWDDNAGINDDNGEPLDFTSSGKRNDDSEDDDEDDEWRFAVILDGHESEVKSVAWSAGGQYLATCSRDKSVWIWEEMEDDNFETIAVLQEHEGDVKSVAWHPQEDLLASSSYDDTIRLYKEDMDDWTCIAILNGHDATVWTVDFEPADVSSLTAEDGDPTKSAWLVEKVKAGPRLISCSDDLTVRVWRRRPKEKTDPNPGQSRMPSIIKTGSIEEDWYEEARLPQHHERAVYSVSWSKATGRVVTTGSDGKIVVYAEQWRKPSAEKPQDVNMDSDNPHIADTEWAVIAEIEGGHDEYEINHATWCRRRDKGKRSEDEEVVITTGDQGDVKAWTLEN